MNGDVGPLRENTKCTQKPDCLFSFRSSLVLTACAASLEERYFETRDGFIRQFEKATSPADSDDRPALAELEKQLRIIIGPINIEGFPKQGRSNLITLLNEMGFGQVDGLRFDSNRNFLFVTTDKLLKNYLARYKLPENLNELSQTGYFYSRVFSSDATVTRYADVPIKISKGESFAYAFLERKEGQAWHIALFIQHTKPELSRVYRTS